MIRTLAAALATSTCLVAVATPAAAQTRQFNVPAGSLRTALDVFARQSGRQVIYRGDVRSARSPGVQGARTAEDALNAILSGSGFVVKTDRSGAFAIVKAGNGQTAGSSSSSGGDVKPDAESGEIVVTASRIDRRDANVPTPMISLGQQMLQEGGRSNIVLALNDQPQFRPTVGPQTQSTGILAGVSQADLRGLGPGRTLVLVNSRRIVGESDLASLPSSLIKRVDVVTGSASAAWGSGAVAGVINLILDDKFSGIRLSGQAGISSRGDGGERQLSGAIGSGFADGRGHIVVGAEYVDSDGVGPQTARANAGRWAVVANNVPGQLPLIIAPDVGLANASAGGLILTGVNAGRTFNSDGTLRPFDFGRVTGTTSIGGEGPANDDVVALIAPFRRYNMIALASYDATDSMQLSAELRYSKVFGNFPISTDINRGNITISRDNAFLPQVIRNQMTAAGETSFTMGRFNADYALLYNKFHRTNYQATLSADGHLGESFRWNAYYSHGVSVEDYNLQNERLADNFRFAVDSVINPVTGQPACRIALTNPGVTCVPINLFGEGVPSAQARAYVTGTAMQHIRRTYDFGGLSIRGEPFKLPAGAVSIAAGLEARRQKDVVTVGAQDAAKAFAFLNFTPFQAANTTKEAFAEVLVPVVRDVPLLRRLELNAAARYTDDRTGGIWSWKLGATNQVLPGVTLRFTRSRDIRNPTLNQLFDPALPQLVNISDPQTNTSYVITSFTGGNPALRPETSKATTFGVTISPRQIPNLTISADRFDINIENAISSIGAQDVITRCSLGNAALCGAITRGPSGVIQTIAGNALNFVKFQTSGVDVVASYVLPITLPGRIRVRGAMTWIDKLETDDGSAVVNYIGNTATNGTINGAPKFNANFGVYYESEVLRLNARARHISAAFYDRNRLIENNHIPAYTYVDVGAAVTINGLGENGLEIYANINNLFDKDPPIGSRITPYYDVMGRYFVAGARVRF